MSPRFETLNPLTRPQATLCPTVGEGRVRGHFGRLRFIWRESLELHRRLQHEEDNGFMSAATRFKVSLVRILRALRFKTFLIVTHR